jgi:hypothetical protein
MASATSSLVPGWAGWALTTTGQPAAHAAAVSPPATENASGKFDAPNTATGPTGSRTRRRSAPRPASARTPHQPSPSPASAKSRSWSVVRFSSPVNRALPRPLSRSARATIAAPRASSSSATPRRKRARSGHGVRRSARAARWAAAPAAATSAGVASWKRPGSSAPVRASRAAKVARPERGARAVDEVVALQPVAVRCAGHAIPYVALAAPYASQWAISGASSPSTRPRSTMPANQFAAVRRHTSWRAGMLAKARVSSLKPARL